MILLFLRLKSIVGVTDFEISRGFLETDLISRRIDF